MSEERCLCTTRQGDAYYCPMHGGKGAWVAPLKAAIESLHHCWDPEIARQVEDVREQIPSDHALSKKADTVLKEAAPSVSGENPATLCRHVVQKHTKKRIYIFRSYERVGEGRCVCSQLSGSQSLHISPSESRRYDPEGRRGGWYRRNPEDWGRRYALDRKEIEQQRTYYHQTADLLFYLDRDDAESVVEDFIPDAPAFLDRLGVSRDASLDEVKKAFRRRSKKVHPGQGGDKQEFIELRESYQLALSFVS